jgi:hypothetical protein
MMRLASADACTLSCDEQRGVVEGGRLRRSLFGDSKKSLRTRTEAIFSAMLDSLIDDLDDLARSGINQYGVIIHIGISIALNVVFAWNIIIGHAIGRQDRANAEVAIVVRGMMLTRDVFMEPWTGIHSKNAANGSCHRAHCAPDDRTYGACVSVAYSGALFGTSNGALRLHSRWQRHCRQEHHRPQFT